MNSSLRLSQKSVTTNQKSTINDLQYKICQHKTEIERLSKTKHLSELKLLCQKNGIAFYITKDDAIEENMNELHFELKGTVKMEGISFFREGPLNKLIEYGIPNRNDVLKQIRLDYPKLVNEYQCVIDYNRNNVNPSTCELEEYGQTNNGFNYYCSYDLKIYQVMKIDVWNMKSSVKIMENSEDLTNLYSTYDNDYLICHFDDLDKMTMKVWDVESNQCIKIFDHGDLIRTFCASKNNRYIVGGKKNGTIKVWDFGSKQCIKVLEGHRDRIISIQITEDENYILSYSEDSTLRVWDFETGNCIKIIKEHIEDGDATSVFNIVNDEHIVTCSYNGAIKVWNFKSGKCVKVVKDKGNCVLSCSITKDNKYIVTEEENDTTVKIYEYETGKCVKVFKGYDFHLMKNSKHIIILNEDNMARIYDLKTGVCVKSFTLKCYGRVHYVKEHIIAKCQLSVQILDLKHFQLQ